MAGSLREKYLLYLIAFAYGYAGVMLVATVLSLVGVLQWAAAPLGLAATIAPLVYHVTLFKKATQRLGTRFAYMILVSLLSLAVMVVSVVSGNFTSLNNIAFVGLIFVSAMLGSWMPAILIWAQLIALLARLSATWSMYELQFGLGLLTVFIIAGLLGWLVYRRHYVRDDPAVEQLRRALQTEQLHSEGVIAALNDGVAILNRDGIIRHVNATFLHMFAVSHEELFGKHYTRVVTSRVKVVEATSKSPRLAPHIREVFATGEPATIDSVRAQYQDGRPPVDATMSVLPLKNDDGDISAVMIIVRDITRIMRLHRLKDEFIATASHELRTPITVISGYADLLLNPSFGDLNDKQRHYIERSKETAAQLTELVNNMLDISRLESGERSDKPENIELKSFITSMTLEARDKFADKRLRVEAAGAECEVKVDRDRLRQLVETLLSNAYKFTPDGGSITLAVTPTSGGVELAISDTGPGIPADKREIIFERFTKLDSSGSIPGTGLGLPIARKIVDDWGGTIYADQADEGGAKFVVTIPKEEAGESDTEVA